MEELLLFIKTDKGNKRTTGSILLRCSGQYQDNFQFRKTDMIGLKVYFSALPDTGVKYGGWASLNKALKNVGSILTHSRLPDRGESSILGARRWIGGAAGSHFMH